MSRWRQMKTELLADKRKLGLGISLLAVALLLWGRLLLKDVPRTATADPDATAQTTDEATNTPAGFDRPDEAVVVVPMYGPVERDLFAFDPTFYERIEQPEQTVQPQPKSDPASADADTREQQLRASVLIESRKLTLQSTLLGKTSRAMINGVLLEPGETIGGFELKQVRTRQVTLVRHGIEVVLEM